MCGCMHVCVHVCVLRIAQNDDVIISFLLLFYMNSAPFQTPVLASWVSLGVQPHRVQGWLWEMNWRRPFGRGTTSRRTTPNSWRKPPRCERWHHFLLACFLLDGKLNTATVLHKIYSVCVCCSITRLLLTERPLMVTSSTCTLVHWTRRVCWRWSAAPTIQGTHTNILTYEHTVCIPVITALIHRYIKILFKSHPFCVFQKI